MLSLIPLSGVALAAAAAFLLGKHRKKQGCGIPDIFLYLTVILPFAAGGFHTYVAAVTAVCLTLHLLTTAKKQGCLRITVNCSSIAAALVLLGYCVTPLWAADKGLAVFGMVRYIPTVLYAVVLMQLTPDQKRDCLAMVPLSGALMTVLSCLLLLIPGADAYLTISGRLAGFLQYPNTYAAFLLAGLVLQYTKDARGRWDLLQDGILVLGVILSGSKTGFLLLIVAVLGIAVIRKKGKTILVLAGLFAAAIAGALLLSRFSALQSAGRFQNIRIDSGSFLLRLLYFRDVLPMILKNPFGYGYMGYRALQGTFQTGRYYVTYIHNGFLQLLFEIGWIPAFVMAAAFLRAMWTKKTAPGHRLLLFVILAHCMVDFDLQFFVFWVILLSCLDFGDGRQWKLRNKTTGRVIAAVVTMLCLWLGTADLCYNCGRPEISLKLTPFHTDALSAALQKTTDFHTLNETAEEILKRNPNHSLAYSAKANAALAQGDVLSMMTCKEQAIRCSRYTAEEYMDYFDKLYAVTKLYLRNGDSSSAEYCERKILELYEMIKSVQEMTNPLTDDIGAYTVLELPVRYRICMRMLETRYQQ